MNTEGYSGDDYSARPISGIWHGFWASLNHDGTALVAPALAELRPQPVFGVLDGACESCSGI